MVGNSEEAEVRTLNGKLLGLPNGNGIAVLLSHASMVACSSHKWLQGFGLHSSQIAAHLGTLGSTWMRSRYSWGLLTVSVNHHHHQHHPTQAFHLIGISPPPYNNMVMTPAQLVQITHELAQDYGILLRRRLRRQQQRIPRRRQQQQILSRGDNDSNSRSFPTATTTATADHFQRRRRQQQQQQIISRGDDDSNSRSFPSAMMTPATADHFPRQWRWIRSL